MKIFDKYIIKEMIPSFITGLSFFTFIFVIQKLPDLIALTVEKGISIVYTLLLLLYKLPVIFAITIPMAVLVSVLMAFSRLSSDSEITAVRASGTSYIRIFRPAYFAGIFMVICSILFNDILMPGGNYAWKETFISIAGKKPMAQLSAREFKKFEGKTVVVDRIDHKNNIMYNITIYQRGSSGTLQTILAEKGMWIGRTMISSMYNISKLKLERGRILEEDPKNPELFHSRPFEDIVIIIKQKTENRIYVEKSYTEMNSIQIWKLAKRLTKDGIKNNTIWIELHQRFSISFACIIFIIIGAPLGLVKSRSSKGLSLVYSILIILVYYILLLLGKNAGKEGKIPAMLSVWIPNLVILAGGIIIHKLKVKS